MKVISCLVLGILLSLTGNALSTEDIKFKNPGSDPFSSGLVEYRIWYASIVNFDPVPLLKSSDVPAYWIFRDPNSINPVPCN